VRVWVVEAKALGCWDLVDVCATEERAKERAREVKEKEGLQTRTWSLIVLD